MHIKSAADDVRNAMTKLENKLENKITVASQTQTGTNGTLSARNRAESGMVQ
jgi:hypothetical protein